MAADSTQALNYIEAPGFPLPDIGINSIPVVGLSISFIEAPTFSSGGGGGGPTRPSSGFLYPRGDY
jgi:hypothetical protein